MMPGMDGQSFLQTLRNNALLKAKPALVLSAAISEDVERMYASDDHTRLVSKPVSPSALVKVVKDLLS
jgi:CheY-like chemotaxis protein